MDTRVTMQSLFQDTASATRQITEQLNTLNAQAATGQKFAKVSDDPADALTVMSNTDLDNRLTAHLTNIQSATTALNTSVSTLQQVNNIFSEAKSLAIQASSSTNDSISYTALAQQVNSLINNLVTVANTQNNGTYVFAGAAANTQPFVTTQDAAGNIQTVAYQGSSNSTSATVDDSQQVQLYYPGSQVFQSQNGGDAFQSLITLRDDLNNVNNLSGTDQIKAISSQISNLDNANTQVMNVIGQQSATLQSLSGLQTQLQNVQLSTKETISTVGGADIAGVVVKLQTYEQQLQLSLESFAQIHSISLLNYLK